MRIRVIGLDLGTSGKTAMSIVDGEDFFLTLKKLDVLESTHAPDVERHLNMLCSQWNPHVVLMELNGPGGVFADYVIENRPHIPLATIDVGLALPEGGDVILWEDSYRLSSREHINIRMSMYMNLRLLFREKRIKLYKDIPELASQLSTLRWDHDPNRGDKLYMISKKKLKLKNLSDLDDEPFSKSPDMADSLALACFAYALLYQQHLEDEAGEPEEVNEIYDPKVPGYFDLTPLDLEYADIETV